MTIIGGSSLSSVASPNNSTFSKTSSWSHVGHRVSARIWKEKTQDGDAGRVLGKNRVCSWCSWYSEKPSPPWSGFESRRRLLQRDQTDLCCQRQTGCELGTCGPSAGRSASLWTDEEVCKGMTYTWFVPCLLAQFYFYISKKHILNIMVSWRFTSNFVPLNSICCYRQ